MGSPSLKAAEASRSRRFSRSVVTTAPVVGSSSRKKESTPLRIVATDHAGTHSSGW